MRKLQFLMRDCSFFVPHFFSLGLHQFVSKESHRGRRAINSVR